jgi:hypothetical protein
LLKCYKQQEADIPAGECKKAGKILASFVDPRQSFGPDKVIPPQILSNAKVSGIVGHPLAPDVLLTWTSGSRGYNSIQSRVPWFCSFRFRNYRCATCRWLMVGAFRNWYRRRRIWRTNWFRTYRFRLHLERRSSSSSLLPTSLSHTRR